MPLIVNLKAGKTEVIQSQLSFFYLRDLISTPEERCGASRPVSRAGFITVQQPQPALLSGALLSPLSPFPKVIFILPLRNENES